MDDPQTWVHYGAIDPELAEIFRQDNTPKFAKDNKISSIPTTRTAWNPIYKELAANALANAQKNGVKGQEIYIPRRDGSLARCLLYQPEQSPPSASPLVVFFHGGGFCFGCPEMESINCINVVQTYRAVAISVEYRLSPESRFPGAIHDSWDALHWIAENASQLSSDPSTGFIIGGTSAGGNISAVVSHLARDEKLSPALTGVYLNIPTVLAPEVVPEKYRSMYLSRQQNKDAPVLTKANMDMYKEAYAPDPRSELWSPFNWPSGHAKLPPHYLQVCGLDLLRDEALIYERVLRRDYNIPTKVDIYPGLPHVFYANFPQHSRSKEYAKDTTQGIGWLLEAQRLSDQ
ncbi:uncharacterized protein A1O5_10623 [Cladophialophora psammophila CBS 110553]|uniref:Alpha/beta hydrolase fold-3 domain-containing protein n=1 Tax=Cladophialophora psammophila CBS 110553 TaxID=1182543 RepID=W9WP93_9EURO|nr:uncharacterized protein A1O5_10623 [Cladophialophora psammophila CBS 110553]EXJ66471.1 hypothetical protein A1O5_10623 [Cladophialophora psammophila CBS 110553]